MVRWSVRAGLAAVPVLLVAVTTVGSAWAAPRPGDPLGLTATAAPRSVPPGRTVTVTVTVANEFDVQFSSVSVSAKNAPDCDRNRLGPLAAGSSTSYRCEVTAPQRPGMQQVMLYATAGTDFEKFTASATAGYEVRAMPSPVRPSPARPSPTESPSATPSRSRSAAATPAVSQPAPPGLPITGAFPRAVITAGVAAGLIATGAGLLLLARRRRSAD